MKALRALPAAGVLMLYSFSIAYGAEVTMERPFGGPPPPKSRKMERLPRGTSCKTPTVSCKLPKAQPIEGSCSCQGDDGKPVSGKVVEHSS